MEQVDIVDEQDNVLYSTSKQEAHEKGLLHRTVISLVIDSHDRWLLVKQASNKQDAGQYVTPVGGHVKAGESVEDSLKREVMEEIGLKNFKYTYTGTSIFNRDILGRHENHYVIMYEIRSDEKLTLNHESVGYKAFTEVQLKQELKDKPEKFGAAFTFVLKTFYPHLL